MEERLNQNDHDGKYNKDSNDKNCGKDDNLFNENEDSKTNPTDMDLNSTNNLPTQFLESNQEILIADELYYHEQFQTKNELNSLIDDTLNHKRNYHSTQSIISNRSIKSHRSLKNRIFGSIKKGSLRGSMFQLSASAIGSGVLSLPYIIAQSGFVLGSIMIITASIAAIISIPMLANCADQIGAPTYTYLIQNVIGRNVDKLLAWLIFLSSIGFSVSYLIIISQMIQVIAINIGFDQNLIQSSEVKTAITAIIGLTILFPAGSIRKMSGFRYITIMSIAFLVYIMLILLFELPQYVKQNYDAERLIFFKLDWDFFQNYSLAVFAFACHIDFVQIYEEMSEKNPQRVSKIVYRSVTINTIFYLIIGLAGYFSTYEMTNKIVIDREPLIGQHIDLLLMIGRIMSVFALCIAFPLKMIPLKQILIHQMYSKEHQMTKGQSILMSFGFVMLTSVIAIIYPNITGVLSIIGGLCSVTIGYVLPTICYIKLNSKKLSIFKKYFYIAFFGILAFIGYTSVILKIIQIFQV
ncbi:UNKNOWN [Stylonychia lemnae]|uniref:Amino acid transporter transmembrane domain-containing protein n=1 Tax=Stylonychia lemnae TaxID=5949 RepID=A0A078AT76_STYLE|nr:UNKNOWN [Stylonychia lemnae]|eukprot:CDW85384.1 UNKNOWN [Stylonychia lemnae]